MYNPPAILPYPGCIDISGYSGYTGLFCYLIEHYGSDGLSVLVYTDNTGKIAITLGDWSGNSIDLAANSDYSVMAKQFLRSYGNKLIDLHKTIQLNQAIYYVAIDTGNLKLVDVRQSLNKYAGPGMVNDVFGKIIPTQKVLGIKQIDDVLNNSLLSGAGEYNKNIIIKPSRFRHINDGKIDRPLYLEIVRCS